MLISCKRITPQRYSKEAVLKGMNVGTGTFKSVNIYIYYTSQMKKLRRMKAGVRPPEEMAICSN